MEGRNSPENSFEERGFLLYSPWQHLQARMQQSLYHLRSILTFFLLNLMHVRMSSLTTDNPLSVDYHRLENHSTTVSCTLFWAIVRPLSVPAITSTSTSSPTKGKWEYCIVWIDVLIDVMKREDIDRREGKKRTKQGSGILTLRILSYSTLSLNILFLFLTPKK